MKALFVVYDGFTEYEYELPASALFHYGVDFEVVALHGRSVTGMMGLQVETPRTLEDLDQADHDALVLPGVANAILVPTGELLPVDQRAVFGDPDLHHLVQRFDRDRRIIAAICSAPAILGAAGVLEGRRVVSSVSDTGLLGGAIPAPGSAVRNGNIITGLGSRPYHFSALLVEALAGEEAAASYRAFAGLPVVQKENTNGKGGGRAS